MIKDLLNPIFQWSGFTITEIMLIIIGIILLTYKIKEIKQNRKERDL